MAMADHTQAGKTFRLSMLIYDSRYRSITIQVIALMILMLIGAWLVSNALHNLEVLDKELGFGFLSDASGYDINQRLIEYDSRSTHGRAAIVGILNTLLVAVLGCVLATILGVSAGVARLSKNWIVARIMTVYIETFRNVPVLLWIILMMAIFIETLPQPRAFKGADPTAHMYLGDSVAITNRGFYIPKPIFNDGSLIVVVVFVLSLIGIWAFGRWSKKRQSLTGEILPNGWIKLGIFVVPTLFAFFAMAMVSGGREYNVVTTATISGSDLSTIEKPVVCVVSETAQSVVLQELLRETGQKVKIAEFATAEDAKAGYASGECNTIGVNSGATSSVGGVVSSSYMHGNPILLEQPYLDGFNFKGGLHLRNSLIALWLALSFYTGAFIAEAVRAGIQAVSHGQTEAAAALGLRPNRTMKLVILPQALRVIIPPLISQYLNLTKNSSLAIAVGYMDVTTTLGGITLNQTGREMESLLLLMAMYLSISITVSVGMNWYNESIKMRER